MAFPQPWERICRSELIPRLLVFTWKQSSGGHSGFLLGEENAWSSGMRPVSLSTMWVFILFPGLSRHTL